MALDRKSIVIPLQGSRKRENTMGGKPNPGTPADKRLAQNKPSTNKPADSGVHQEKFNQERQRQKDGGVTTDVKQS